MTGVSQCRKGARKDNIEERNWVGGDAYGSFKANKSEPEKFFRLAFVAFISHCLCALLPRSEEIDRAKCGFRECSPKWIFHHHHIQRLL